MKGYEKSGQAMAKGEKGMSKYPVLTSTSKGMYGVDTMSEYYDMNRVQNLRQTLRGQPAQAWEYKY